MNKPKPKQRKQILDWHDVESFIEEKYNCCLRDWAGKFHRPEGVAYSDDVEYLDFWHVICDMSEIHNGCEFTLSLNPDDYDPERIGAMGNKTDWVKQILTFIKDEFGEHADGDYLDFYVDW